MPHPRRPHSMKLCGRIDSRLVDELLQYRPELRRVDPAGGHSHYIFAHGAAGRYLERLIREDIERLRGARYTPTTTISDLDDLLEED